MSTSRLRPRCLSVLLAALLLWGGLPTASAQPQRAVRADTLYTMTGDPIENGVVLIENETIAAVGPASEVDVPASAEVHKASVVTPGLIDPRGTVGLSGIYNVPADQDQLDTSEPTRPY